MPWKPYKDLSREDWGRDENGSFNHDDLKIGAILRIADAVEKMARSYDALIRDRDFYKRRTEALNAKTTHLNRRIRSLRGVITRMKK